MSQTYAQIAKLRAALAEVLARRNVFSDETYTQIILAIYDRIRTLQTQSQGGEAETASDELRVVTVMFIDVIDSTKITLKMDAEDWKAVISEAHRRLSDVVRSWGGDIGQYLGDGLLCFFGAYRSQDDDAVQAVACALAIQEEMARYAAQIRWRHDIAFAIRIGISTGRVVVGVIGEGGKRDVLAVGTTTHLAARLQSLCEPGRVRIDAETQLRVRHHFITEKQPSAPIKGFDDPIESYTVVARSSRPAAELTTTRIAGIDTSFVGRAAEIEQIIRACAVALEMGRLHALTLYGDVGLGKSRLLQTALERAAELGFAPILLVGSYEKRSTAYQLLTYLLQTRCNLKDDTPQEVAEERITAYIASTWADPDAPAAAAVMGFLAGFGFGDSPHVRPLKAGGTDRSRLARARVAQWFRGQAGAGPLLIAVDNLQWVDRESRDLIEYLVYALADLPVVLLSTTRLDFPGDFLRDYPLHRAVVLEPLAPTETNDLIQSVLQYIDEVPTPLPQLVAERAEGNPLFVEELLYMLFDNGVFEATQDGRWRVNRFLYATLSSGLPNGLLGLLQARLDDLSPLARRVAQAAAVVGQTFWAGPVMRMLNVDNMGAALREMEARRIIVAQPVSSFQGEREYSFRQALYREAAYSMLIRPTREAYHRHVAAWLAERVSDRPDYLGMLAEHYAESMQQREALTVYLLAAEDRLKRGFLGETLVMIEGGLAAARAVPRELALPLVSHLWMLQAQALDALDRYEEASAASQTALMLMDELPFTEMVEERVIAARTLGSAFVNLGRYDEALDSLNNAHSLLPKENVHQHAAVLRTFGMLYQGRGQLDEALAYQAQALRLAEESGRAREIARVLAVMGDIALDRGRFADALDYYEQVLAINTGDENLYYQALDLRAIGGVYLQLFAYDAALLLSDEAAAMQARIRYRDVLVDVQRGLALVALDRTNEGLALLTNAAHSEHPNRHTRLLARLGLIRGLALAGDYSLCRKLARGLAAEARRINHLIHGRALLWLGMAEYAQGDGGAEETLRTALTIERRYGGRDLWLCHYGLGLAALGIDQRRASMGRALAAMESIAASLDARPDLQQALVDAPMLRQMREGAGE